MLPQQWTCATALISQLGIVHQAMAPQSKHEYTLDPESDQAITAEGDRFVVVDRETTQSRPTSVVVQTVDGARRGIFYNQAAALLITKVFFGRYSKLEFWDLSTGKKLREEQNDQNDDPLFTMSDTHLVRTSYSDIQVYAYQKGHLDLLFDLSTPGLSYTECYYLPQTRRLACAPIINSYGAETIPLPFSVALSPRYEVKYFTTFGDPEIFTGNLQNITAPTFVEFNQLLRTIFGRGIDRNPLKPDKPQATSVGDLMAAAKQITRYNLLGTLISKKYLYTYGAEKISGVQNLHGGAAFRGLLMIYDLEQSRLVKRLSLESSVGGDIHGIAVLDDQYFVIDVHTIDAQGRRATVLKLYPMTTPDLDHPVAEIELPLLGTADHQYTELIKQMHFDAQGELHLSTNGGKWRVWSPLVKLPLN